jgi:hypothetical protein
LGNLLAELSPTKPAAGSEEQAALVMSGEAK